MEVYLGPEPGSLIWAIRSGEYPRAPSKECNQQPVYDLPHEPVVLASEYWYTVRPHQQPQRNEDSPCTPTYSDCEDEDEGEDNYEYEDYADSSESEPELEPDDEYQY